MRYFGLVICSFLLYLTVRGAPLDTGNLGASTTSSHHIFFEDSDDSGWPLSNAVLMRDTIDSFYKNVVDDVLSAYNEDLLISITRRRNRLPLLRNQAALLGFPYLPDVCVQKMPGMIATHTHQLTSRIFAAISPAVDASLPAVWPDYEAFEATTPAQGTAPAVPQHVIATAVYSLNQAVAYTLVKAIQDYDLVDQLKQDIHACATTPIDQDDVLGSIFQRAKNAFWTGCASVSAMVSSRQNKHNTEEIAFLVSHLKSLRIGLFSELEAHIGDLIVVLYKELYNHTS